MHEKKKVRRMLVSAVLGTIKKLFDKYGDYDDVEAEDRDFFENPIEINYQYTLDGHFFVVRGEGFPETGNGIDVDIFNNGNVDITVYCYPKTTQVSLIVFDEEGDIDSAVKLAQEIIALLIEDIFTGFSVYHLHRYLSYCNDHYTWRDALKDYKSN